MITKMVLTTAIVTGLFCAGFAFVIEQVTDVLTLTQALLLAMISGFCGSLFAQLLFKGKPPE